MRLTPLCRWLLLKGFKLFDQPSRQTEYAAAIKKKPKACNLIAGWRSRGRCGGNAVFPIAAAQRPSQGICSTTFGQMRQTSAVDSVQSWIAQIPGLGT